jgi:hypothetical protein
MARFYNSSETLLGGDPRTGIAGYGPYHGDNAANAASARARPLFNQ